MNAPLIDIQGLTRHFEGHGYALNGVNLRLNAGSTLGLIGRNGAGKTTLIRSILGLSVADAGSIKVFGEDARTLSASAKQRIGYVPQQASLPGGYSISCMLELYLHWQPKWDQAYALQLMDRLQLVGNPRIGNLSVGQQQALALVLALAHRPELLMLDEPVAALDPIARRTVASILAGQQAETGMSILFSTHILSDLERLASHVALLEKGNLRFVREVDSIKDEIELWRSPTGSNLDAVPDFSGLLRRIVDPSQALLVDLAQGASRETVETQLGASLEAQRLTLEDFVVESLK
ncbi:MAG: ABC transporter ATP-binding protein [Formivibrio sp.]|nr:ABC transporter ATP-binding protein [Formivibrio sp.]